MADFYKKKYSYAAAKNGKDHIISNICSWCSKVLYEYNSEWHPKKDYLEIGKAMFEKIYTSERELFWSDNDFREWWEGNNLSDDKLKSPHCEYCELEAADLEKFYCKVNSYRYQRGQNFEIDRKVGLIYEYYINEEKDITCFVTLAEEAISTIEIKEGKGCSLFETLKKTLNDQSDEAIYHRLPAPYNKNNCVVACAWCNNAKTDAFSYDEFKPIGVKIGEKIKSILEKRSEH